MFDIKIKGSIGRIIIMLLVLSITIIGGTFAWFTYKSRESALVLSIGDINDSRVIIEPYQIRETLVPTNSYTGGVYSQITAINNNSNKLVMNLFYKVNQIDELLINNGLRYTIVSSDSKDGEYKEVDTGDFTGISNNKLKILNIEIDSNKTVYYRVYLWLDTNAGNQVVIQNSVLDVELNGDINQVANQPILDEGMVPVVIYEDGTVMTTNENDLDWYDYENQKWANIVLVNENASSSEGSKSREYYLNNLGTEVLESDILAYYVWIPRYKYKIWTTGVSSAGQEQSIDIVFESRYDEMSLGTNVGEYRSHPAFWWDNDNDSLYDEGEMLPGIWVGKFEITGNATQPTVKPNMASLRSQNVSTQFKTSLLFAGGSMNTSTGEVTFTGNNTYGLTDKTNSHMMKNSEWGATAYLSHSQYGINEEVRLNNYWSNSKTLTGCGAASANAATATTCGITYGTPSIEINTYPQSTTGNITGIFDMSGGAWEYVMGNYNKTIGSSGFTTYPERKYYDLYTSTDISTACNGEVCYGHALSETNNWYGDLVEIPTTSKVWFLRSGSYSSTKEAGLFVQAINTGASNAGMGYRSVLIPKMNYTVNFDVNGGDEWVDISYTTPGEYEFVVPYDGEYQLELWGAQGGNYNSTKVGGYGGYTSGIIQLNKNQEMYVFVGGTTSTRNGGFNGGASVDGECDGTYRGGGGSTDVRFIDGEWNDFDSLKSRIMVAGGGAGSGYYSKFIAGGNAGGLNGYTGTYSSCNSSYKHTVATAGTQTSGGLGINNGTSLGYFGYSTHGGGCYGTGGGSGYYGGGSGGSTNCNVSTGAGGSSFISGHIGCDAISETSTSSNIIHLGQSNHYSGYVFDDTIMIDGSGYGWTSVKESLQQMPNPNGGYYSSGVGHSGDGAARIRQVSSKDIIYGYKYGNISEPTREGYVFAGWYTEPEGGIKVTEDTNVDVLGDHTLYARWDVVDLSINYSVNGGIIDSSTTDGNTAYNWSTNADVIYLDGEKYISNVTGSQLINLSNYNDSNFMNISRDGYGVQDREEWICLSGCKFKGLTFNQDVEYKISDFCDGTKSECNVVLGVNWLEKYTITYDANGGTNAPSIQNKLHGVSIDLSLVEPVNDKYVFAGWSIDPNAISPTYYSGSEYTLNGDVILYAVWRNFKPFESYSCANGSVGTEPYAITYTGNCTVIDDGDGNWRVKFLTNGTFTTTTEMTIDVFLVGGGGGGGNDYANGSIWYGGGGGGGGYVTNSSAVISSNIEYKIIVGAGGAAATVGGKTSAFGLSAAGGKPGSGANGGAGGSGGGAGSGADRAAANGGSNGNSGNSSADATGGTGTGKSTYEFGDSSLTLYSGGGGGGGGAYCTDVTCYLGSGGSGGRGGGANPEANAANNTGGGGGGAGGKGGSGIVVIRNSNSISSCNGDDIQSENLQFTYTGECETINDGDGNWRIKFLTDGIFTSKGDLSVDVFLVGGGGGGGNNYNNGAVYYGGGGGGGGYVTNSSLVISNNIEYEINIGAGGTAATSGKNTSAFGLNAEGGSPGSGIDGGSGGSGGGAGSFSDYSAANGGSNGSSGGGGNGTGTGGIGSGKSTYEFGDTSLTLYAGGGGGANGAYCTDVTCYQGTTGSGGSGGGAYGNGSSAVDNTGGGGGGAGGSGGSGIVVIRNKR